MPKEVRLLRSCAWKAPLDILPGIAGALRLIGNVQNAILFRACNLSYPVRRKTSSNRSVAKRHLGGAGELGRGGRQFLTGARTRVSRTVLAGWSSTFFATGGSFRLSGEIVVPS